MRLEEADGLVSRIIDYCFCRASYAAPRSL